MARAFDAGKADYAKAHRTSSEQDTRHIISNSTLEHYGASPEKYAKGVAADNYRMGSQDTNRSRDTRLDNAIIGETFRDAGNPGGYDSKALTRPTAAASGLSYQQQLDGVGARFDAAKSAYETTGEYKYFMMQKDLRDIATDKLDGDGRQFRLSSRK